MPRKAAAHQPNSWMKGGWVTATPDVCELGGEKAWVGFAPGACEEGEGGDLPDGWRRTFRAIADALEHDWGGEAHEGGVADAAAEDPFGKGSIPRHLRVDRLVPMREQITGPQADSAKMAEAERRARRRSRSVGPTIRA
jgi:hypothetical protein